MADNTTPHPIELYISSNYIPCSNYMDADVKMSLNELFFELSESFPMMDYTREMLFNYLNKSGFITMEPAPFHIEWLLKRKP
jgi:hypothetical protein